MLDLSILVTPEVLLIAAAAFALLATLGRLPFRGKPLARAEGWRRVLPVLPLALGVAAAVCPGVVPAAEGGAVLPIASRVLVGLWAGFIASHLRKLVKQTVLAKMGGKE
jgi:hypothetical protein